MSSSSPSPQQPRNIIVVLSGKGGVGKSTVACQLALSLAHNTSVFAPNREGGKPFRIGILDVDICGPSVPKICGVEHGNVQKNSQGQMIPVELFKGGSTTESGGRSLQVMSISFLLPSADSAVVWRGPRKDAMIKEFINNVDWSSGGAEPLDFLIVDTPPGTSDEHLTLVESIRELDPTGAVVVTTPQNVATDDVRKELSFCHKLKLRCLGIVENMSGFVCPHCSVCTNIFSKGGGQKLATMYEVPFLGFIPLDPTVSLSEDAGRCVMEVNALPKAPEVAAERDPDSSPPPAQDGGMSAGEAVAVVVGNVMEQVERVERLRAERRQEDKGEASTQQDSAE